MSAASTCLHIKEIMGMFELNDKDGLIYDILITLEMNEVCLNVPVQVSEAWEAISCVISLDFCF